MASISLQIPVAATRKGQEFLTERLGYDFVGLFVKIFFFYIVAIAIQKLHIAITGAPSFIADIAGFFGMNLPRPENEPNFLKRLFSEQGYAGLSYWNLVNAVLMALVTIEALLYLKSNQAVFAKPSYITLAIFALIVIFLASFTIPDIKQKLQSGMMNREQFR